MTKPNIAIPKSRLRAQLDEAEAIRREMAAMLRELEQRTPHHPDFKPGAWRHHPSEWSA